MNPPRISNQVPRPNALLGPGSRMESIDDTSIGATDNSHDSPYPPQQDQHGQTGASVNRTKPELVPASDRLATFRTLVGIDHAPALTTASYFKRPVENIGLYGRVTIAEKELQMKHRIFAFLINACLGLQLMVAAAITALGAGNGPHKVVTAFGAINTVIAGFLTYLKGSGLPNRLRYYQNEWTKIREYIEQRERDFCREGCTLDVETEVAAVEAMYEAIKGDIEINTPDSFVSVNDVQKKNPDAFNSRPPLSRGISYRGHNPLSQYTSGQNLSAQLAIGQNRQSQYSSNQSQTGQYSSAQIPSGQFTAYAGEKRIKPEIITLKDKEKNDGTHMV